MLVFALAGAASLAAASSVIASLSHEDAIRLRLSELPPVERSLRAEYRAAAGARVDSEAVTDGALAGFDAEVGPHRRARFWDPIQPADERGIRFVELDDFGSGVSIVAGRLPRGCDDNVCEAISLSRAAFEVGDSLVVGGVVRVRVVARGVIDTTVVPASTNPRGRALIVPPRQAALRTVLASSGSVTVAAAELEPEAVHGYSLETLAGRLRTASVRLSRKDPGLLFSGPLPTLERLSRDGRVARQRLLLIAGQGAALLLAFAAFAAASRRDDLVRFGEQLETLRASRRQFALARVLEAAVPSVLGFCLSIAAIEVALEVIRRLEGLPRAFVGQALPWETIGLMIALTVVGGALLFASPAPRRHRFGLGGLELGALTALAVISWQTATTSALDADAIARGESGGPILLLLPALSVYSAAILLLRLLPAFFRLAERRARSAPFGLRLALLASARNPGQAAAATTFLAVALGSALFSLNYRETLDQHASATAAFEVGADWRVIERGDFGAADVAPLTRYATATPARPLPVLRLQGVLRDTGRLAEEELGVLGLPSEAITGLKGWRPNFSRRTRAQIASSLSNARSSRSLRGPLIPKGARAVRLWVRAETSVPRSLELALLTPGAGFERLPLGATVRRWRRLQLKLPRALPGARLVGVRFPPATGAAALGTADEGSIDLGPLEVRVGDRWQTLTRFGTWVSTPLPGRRGFVYQTLVSDAPVPRVARYGLSGAGAPFIRPRSPLPPLLPVLVSPQVASAAVDDVLTLEVLGQRLTLRSVARASYFPTILERPRRFVVLDYDTLFSALNLEHPGVAPPSEAWFFGRQPDGFAQSLASPPFRVERAVSAERLERRLRDDPLAAGAATVLLIGGLTGAALSVFGLTLASRSALQHERQLLAEYEALGISPSVLAASVRYRLLLLSGLGVVGAVIGAALAVSLTSAFVAVTGAVGRPLPPIEPALAWVAAGLLLLAVSVVAVFAAARQATAYLAEPTGSRLRG